MCRKNLIIKENSSLSSIWLKPRWFSRSLLINKMTEKYPNIKIRFRVHKWLETEATIIFNENVEPYVT